MLYSNLVNQAFQDKVNDIAGQLGINPDWLMYVMHNESGFNPAAKNPNGSATGLIQFISSTANSLGTSTAALAGMDAITQLDYVNAYYQSIIKQYGALGSVSDVYLATFNPAALNWPASQRFSNAIYNGNKIFDYDNLGYLTKQDFIDYVNFHYSQAGGTNDYIPSLAIDGLSTTQTDDIVVIVGAGLLLLLLVLSLYLLKRKK